MKVEPWERPHIRRYFLIFVLTGLAGMALMTVIGLLLRGTALAGQVAATLFIPWFVGGMFLIPAAFHAGAERQRQNQEEASKPGENPSTEK
jgi:ABC-type transport system involved in cytochrome bd biosynthesis fused ATPase/permease subunit